MELTELPVQLVIVGGGYIGLEFASMYVSFGSQVTVLEGSSELISREDRDIADSVREVLEQKGIVFRLNARVQSVKDSDVIYRDAVTGEEHPVTRRCHPAGYRPASEYGWLESGGGRCRGE